MQGEVKNDVASLTAKVSSIWNSDINLFEPSDEAKTGLSQNKHHFPL